MTAEHLFMFFFFVGIALVAFALLSMVAIGLKIVKKGAAFEEKLVFIPGLLGVVFLLSAVSIGEYMQSRVEQRAPKTCISEYNDWQDCLEKSKEE